MRLLATLFLLLFSTPAFASYGLPQPIQGQVGGVSSTVANEIFVQTGTLTYANSTTATNLIGSGIGTTTLPANFWVVGRVVHVWGRGVFSTAALLPSLTVNPKAGAISLATATLANLLSGASNSGFQFDLYLTCRSTGTSGTVMVDGSVSYATGTGTLGRTYLNNAGATTTMDTTVSQALSVFGAWSTASASNTLSVTSGGIEVFN